MQGSSTKENRPAPRPAAAPAPATGKLGILTPGLGAVATTFMAGVESIRRGLTQPIGSLSQMATIRLGKRTDNRSPLIKDFVPLADLKDIVFGAWDPIPDDAYTAAKKAGVLEDRHLKQRTFPLGPGFWVDGEPVELVAPGSLPRTGAQADALTDDLLTRLMRLWLANRGVWDALPGAGPTVPVPASRSDVDLYLQAYGELLAQLR